VRIHRLEVEAFGPFAERVDVDVDELASGGLFLVHGPTGSGKTSLLDAVCFALYGDVPGARRKQGLRSDHAGPDAVPEVLLELTVGTRRWRLTRSPEWQRPKRRGSGTTREQARVLLEERTDTGWHTVSTRNDEVADVVLDVLGMGLSQFAKVVMLPQGDFAAFLGATPEERREVLERLFDIEVYRDVEDWLSEQRRTLGAELDRAGAALAADLTRLEDALAGAAETEGSDTPVVPLAELGVETVPARLASLSDALAASLTGAMADADAATGAEQLAQQALAEARARATARGRGLQARVRAAALAAARDEHRERLATLAAAERAARVAGHLVGVERAESDLALRTAAAASAEEAVAALRPATDGEPAGTWAQRLHRLDGAAADLAHHAESARVADHEAEHTGARLEATRQRLSETAARSDAAADELREHTARARALAAVAAQAPQHALRLEGAESRLATLDAAEADRAERARLAPALIASRDAVLGAQAELERLRQRRLDGMAAQLAARLTAGDPCPVCGSAEHPGPAVATDPVSDDELRAAEAGLEAARAAGAAVEAEDTRLAAAVETRLAGLDGADRETLAAEVVQAREALAAARAAEDSLETAEEHLGRLRARVDALMAEHSRLEATAASLAERVDELTEQAATARSALDAAADEHGSCPCGSTDPRAHARLGGAVDDLAAAEHEREAAVHRLEVATTDLATAIADVGFADAAHARAAARPEAEVVALREAVEAHVREEDACRAVLDDPEVSAALEGDAPDLDALDDAARAARRAVLSTTTAQHTVERAAQALARLRPAIEAGCADVVALTERHARVRELADAVTGTGGDNTLRMRLTSFVLAARLEKVASLANERLRVMGGGRYLLEHTDDLAARGARSGLGLRVLDQWTGRTRDTATLSGGEAFMASLALALGLADAVREESGGLDLGTLFVDEGFGSLDEDSLEEVLTVLDGLREGGRAVGVVSHVADLRSRIPHQAVVRKSATGSTVIVRTGADGAVPAA
jgi:DNA repair protein SbcC/Rad50